jgi:hypothetical protein
MHRAMRRKAQINLDYTGMISPSKAKSYLSFSTLDINSKLSSVGIKRGCSEKDIFISSNALRRMEVDHLTVTPARLSSLYELKATSRKSGSCSSKKGKKPKKRAKVSPSTVVFR